MAWPMIINRIMKINNHSLWIRDLEDFINELYFQGVIPDEDKEYILNLIHKNTKGRNAHLQDFITDIGSAVYALEDVMANMQEEADGENDYDD